MRNLFRKYDPLKTRKRFRVRGNGKSIYFDCTEKIRGILYVRNGAPSIWITKESPMKYKKADDIWVGEQILKSRITEIHAGGHTDIKIPLQVIAKINNEGEREVKTLYKYEKQGVEKYVNGIKLLGSQVEFIEKLNEVEKARLKNISIFEVRDTLLTALAKTPRKWSNYLNAVQAVYNRIDNRDFHRTKTVKVPYEWESNHLINASIVLEVHGYDFFLTEGGVMDCGGVDVHSYLFDLPRAEIIKSYIKEVII